MKFQSYIEKKLLPEFTIISMKQVHSFVTQEEVAKIVVFRVNEMGQPERFPVEA